MKHAELKTTVFVDRLFLWTENPRHDEVDDEKEAIDRLCKTEDIEEIARDIVRYGPSPAERLIVYPTDENVGLADIDSTTTFIVAEGNRRVCALKLLHDPDLAPAKIRDAITKLADGWDQEAAMDVVIILDAERRHHWIKRIHDGVQGGKGRKPWNAEQKTRFSGTRRNIIAQQLFDYAAGLGLLKPEDRKGSFSHMARLVGNVLVAEALGLDLALGVDELHRNRPKAEFDIIISAVVKEAVQKSLGSQASKVKIDGFARRVSNLEGVTQVRIESEPVVPAKPPSSAEPTNVPTEPERVTGAEDTKKPDSQRPKPPTGSKYITSEPEIVDGLKLIDAHKLESLYFSICILNAEHHTPLIAVGVWSFFECITASMGRSDKQSFKDYLHRGKLSQLNVAVGQQLNAPVEALGRVSAYGNVTKHHSVAANFDYRQIINDMKTLKPVVLACLQEVK